MMHRPTAPRNVHGQNFEGQAPTLLLAVPTSTFQETADDDDLYKLTKFKSKVSNVAREGFLRLDFRRSGEIGIPGRAISGLWRSVRGEWREQRKPYIFTENT
jgi:hypothetical protein